MKIYNRTEFMKLPEGTIFSSGQPFVFYDLRVKGESLEVDFLESSLMDIDCHCSKERAERFEEMHEKGTSYPINKSFGREGLFDDEMLYVIYEKEDLEYMIETFKEAIDFSKKKSDGYNRAWHQHTREVD